MHVHAHPERVLHTNGFLSLLHKPLGLFAFDLPLTLERRLDDAPESGIGPGSDGSDSSQECASVGRYSVRGDRRHRKYITAL